jgi:fluoride exporter
MKVLLNCLVVGASGFVGALCRYGVGAASLRLFGRAFPVGTLVVNLSGAFLIGWFFAWSAHRSTVSDALRLAVVTGFLGAYTTFSALVYESDALLRQGASTRAMLNLVGSLVIGLLFVRLGAIAAARL